MFKIVFRRPVLIMITCVLLIAAITLLGQQVAVYSEEVNKINNMQDQYKGIISVEKEAVTPSDPAFPLYIQVDRRIGKRMDFSYQTMDRTEITSLQQTKYISSVDIRKMVAGICQEYTRLGEGNNYYDYLARCVIKGTLTDIIEGDVSQYPQQASLNKIRLTNCELVYGDDLQDMIEGEVSILALPLTYEQGMTPAIIDSNQQVIAWYDASYIYDTAYLQSLEKDKEYYVVALYHEAMGACDFYLADYLTTMEFDAIVSAEDSQKINLLGEIITNDTHTFDVVFTKGTQYIPRFADRKMMLYEGRDITEEDRANQAEICLISKEVSEAYQLGIGDQIVVAFGNQTFEQYDNLGALSIVPQRVSSELCTKTLTVVGLYESLDSLAERVQGPNWSYSVNTIFVPDTLFEDGNDTQGEQMLYSPSEVSLIIDNPDDVIRFETECVPSLEAQGYRVMVRDGGWLEIRDSFDQSQKASILRILLYGLVGLAVLIFAVRLYIGKQKRNYATILSLGAKIGEANKAVVLPFGIVLISSLAIGNILAAFMTYASTKPVGVVAILFCCETIVATCLVLLHMNRLNRKSIVELLQGNRE